MTGPYACVAPSQLQVSFALHSERVTRYSSVTGFMGWATSASLRGSASTDGRTSLTRLSASSQQQQTARWGQAICALTKVWSTSATDCRRARATAFPGPTDNDGNVLKRRPSNHLTKGGGRVGGKFAVSVTRKTARLPGKAARGEEKACVGRVGVRRPSRVASQGCPRGPETHRNQPFGADE
jgi:hypothetical protein